MSRKKRVDIKIYSYYNRGENQTEWHAKVNGKYIGWFDTPEQARKYIGSRINRGLTK